MAEACECFPGRITVGIDARDGKVAVQGWTQATELAATALAEQCQTMGAGEIVYTDIARDGTGQGVNIKATRTLALIIGRALYTGAVNLAEAIRLGQGLRESDKEEL